MKILVINVSLRPKSLLKLFPIGLGYIVTAIKEAGFDFDLIDIDAHRYTGDEVERLIRKKDYDAVCMGCIVTGYGTVKSLSALVRQCHPHAKIIVGNSVATSIIETLLTKTEVDIGVMGEGDLTIVELLEAIMNARPLEGVKGICFRKEGKIIRNQPRDYIKDISSLHFIDFSLFDVETYIKNSQYQVNDSLPIPKEEVRLLPVNTARGCISRCTFCYHNFQSVPYRWRSAPSIVKEIGSLIRRYSLNFIGFWDELTFFSKKQTLELAQEILDSGLQFWWMGNCRGNLFNEDSDVGIIRKMKEAGCVGLGYALESSNPDILKAMHKNVTVKQFCRQTELCHRAGLPVLTSLVLGYPQETPETIRETFNCCIENKVYPSAGYLLPQPGSAMYSYAVEHGFIDNEENYLLAMGDRQDLRLNMTKMPDDEFQLHVIEGLKRCNEEMNMGLKAGELIKTQYNRANKK